MSAFHSRCVVSNIQTDEGWWDITLHGCAFLCLSFNPFSVWLHNKAPWKRNHSIWGRHNVPLQVVIDNNGRNVTQMPYCSPWMKQITQAGRCCLAFSFPLPWFIWRHWPRYEQHEKKHSEAIITNTVYLFMNWRWEVPLSLVSMVMFTHGCEIEMATEEEAWEWCWVERDQ